MSAPAAEVPRKLGRYALHAEIAAGGMASVHLGKLRGAVGFSRIVAIKRIHPQFAQDADFVAMFLDEARLASRVRHSNVVAPLDVVTDQGEVFLVMEYVEGESLAQLLKAAEKAGERVPVSIALALMGDVLHGLHAVHEATDERGEALRIVHRDVTPQNILVGTDGAARLADFGVAKAVGRLHTTRSGAAKGKLAYMPPEQVQGRAVTRQSDVYAAGVTLWELLAGRRMLEGDSEGELVLKIISAEIPALRSMSPDLPAALGEAVERAIARDPAQRFGSALEFFEALELAAPAANARQVAAWVNRLAAPALERRRGLVSTLEAATPRGTSEPPVAAARPSPERREITANALSADASSKPPDKPRFRAALVLAVAAATLGVLLLLSRSSETPPGPARPAASPPGLVGSAPAFASATSVEPSGSAPVAGSLRAAASAASSGPPPAPPSAQAPGPPSAERVVRPRRAPRPVTSEGRRDAGVSDDLLGRF